MTKLTVAPWTLVNHALENFWFGFAIINIYFFLSIASGESEGKSLNVRYINKT